MTTATPRALEEGRDELTEEEARQYVGEQTEKYLGLSYDAFIELAAAGKLPDDPMTPHLVLLAGVEASTC